MSTGTANASPAVALPGDDLIGLEHRLEERVIGQLVGHAPEGDAGGEGWHHGAVQRHDGDGIAGGKLTSHGGDRQARVIALEEVQGRRHQNIRKRRPRLTRLVISSRETRTTGWPSAFQSGSLGTDPTSTWNGTPRRLRF